MASLAEPAVSTAAGPIAQPGSSYLLQVAVETPRHVGLAEGLLHYASAQTLEPGSLVRVPLGRREVPGVVWACEPAPLAAAPAPSPDARQGSSAGGATAVPKRLQGLKAIRSHLASLPPLSDNWRALVQFTASYYQRAVGEVAISVLPPQLKLLDDTSLARRLARKLPKRPAVREDQSTPGAAPIELPQPPALSADQAAVLAQLEAPPATAGAQAPTLLHGVTGSGKTEVYLRLAAQALQRGQQVLVLVPEINLTPQLEARLAARFGSDGVVSLHSGLTPAQRLRNWLSAHAGQAQLVLGTRLGIFASMPRLGLIVVDEEHDPSFKQQDGARYSARDLAVWRARALGIPVVLGSATPSLETWQRVQEGRYRRLALPARIGAGALPKVLCIEPPALPPASSAAAPLALAPKLLAAIEERIARGEQSLLLLNRRGYAPVLHCGACSWKSACAHCSAWRVFHKSDRSLRCHHCGLAERVPRACPECGNLDIQPMGRGTEKLQEQISQALPAARVARIDADTTRAAGSLAREMAAVHAGEVDILVGTQILAKGHDFRRVTLVAAVNPDNALYSSDFRAPERLFALLMQAAGRAGRDASLAPHSQMWLQTTHPRHPLYTALAAHNYEAFAASQLAERKAAGLPPFASLALLRAESKDAAVSTAYLQQAREAMLQAAGDWAQAITIYPPVPPPVARVADVERVQMLVESHSRAALQKALALALPVLDSLRSTHKGVLRWAVDVDPVGI